MIKYVESWTGVMLPYARYELAEGSRVSLLQYCITRDLLLTHMSERAIRTVVLNDFDKQ